MRASFHQQKSPAAAEADGRMAEIPQKKRAVTCKPLSPPPFPPPAIGHGDQEYARAQGESAAGAPSGHRRAGKSSSPPEHPSRPGRPSAPETAPIGWDWRRLGGHGGCLTSLHAAIPSFCKTTDPSGPAVDQSHLLGRPSQCLYGRCGVPGINVMDGASRSFEVRTACCVCCFSLSVRRIRRGRDRRGGDCETWIRRGSRPSRSTEKRAWPWSPGGG